MGGVAVPGDGGGQEGPLIGFVRNGGRLGSSFETDGGDGLLDGPAAPNSLRTPFMGVVGRERTPGRRREVTLTLIADHRCRAKSRLVSVSHVLLTSMSFTFNWPRFSDQFHYDAIQMLNTALNKGNKPPIIADRIEVVELEMGTQVLTVSFDSRSSYM